MDGRIDIYQNKMVSIENDCVLTIDNDYIAPPSQWVVYAGGSSTVLKSIDFGETWSNIGNTIYGGAITCFCRTSSGKILAGTSLGRVFPITLSNVGVEVDTDVKRLLVIDNYIYAFKSNGKCYVSEDDGVSFSFYHNYYNTDTDVMYNVYTDGTNIFVCGSYGVWRNNIVTTGRRHWLLFYFGNNTIYSYSTTVPYKYVSYNNGVSWTNPALADDLVAFNSTIIGTNATRIIGIQDYITDTLRYTDDVFNTSSTVSIGSENIESMCILEGDIVLLGTADGDVLRSDDNAENFSNLGKWFSQTAINSFIVVEE